jgi:hypothetical protein
MKSYKTKFMYPVIAVAVAAMTYLVACNASNEGYTGGSVGSVLPMSGAGGQGASGSGVAGTVAGQSGGVGPAGTGGSAGSGGTKVVVTGGTGGTVLTGGTGAIGGPPDVFDSGIGDGQAGTIAGTGGEAGTTAGTGGEAGTTAGTGGVGGQGKVAPGCVGLTIPPVSDYAVNGPFATTWVDLTGPGGAYTMIKPQTLGDNGFTKHPVATWGNGITTTPILYPGLLDAIASHGFVVIASNSPNVTAAMMRDGLEWLIQQNNAAGEFQGKLATECAITIGYSLGGGAAVSSGSHPSVVATVSFHGLQGSAEQLHGPLLLFTSTADGFVTKAGYVQPCYNRSSVVPTILATLEIPGAAADFLGHLYPLGDAGEERAPAMAWLRLWVYGDLGAEKYFYGPDCLLCKSPWTDIQRKNANW